MFLYKRNKMILKQTHAPYTFTTATRIGKYSNKYFNTLYTHNNNIYNSDLLGSIIGTNANLNTTNPKNTTNNPTTSTTPDSTATTDTTIPTNNHNNNNTQLNHHILHQIKYLPTLDKHIDKYPKIIQSFLNTKRTSRQEILPKMRAIGSQSHISTNSINRPSKYIEVNSEILKSLYDKGLIIKCYWDNLFFDKNEYEMFRYVYCRAVKKGGELEYETSTSDNEPSTKNTSPFHTQRIITNEIQALINQFYTPSYNTPLEKRIYIHYLELKSDKNKKYIEYSTNPPSLFWHTL